LPEMVATLGDFGGRGGGTGLGRASSKVSFGPTAATGDVRCGGLRVSNRVKWPGDATGLGAFAHDRLPSTGFRGDGRARRARAWWCVTRRLSVVSWKATFRADIWRAHVFSKLVPHRARTLLGRGRFDAVLW